MIKPFFNYIGGKTRILDSIIENAPTGFRTYVEPFLGGGAVYLAFSKNKQCYVNDINQKLINAWRVFASFPKEMYAKLTEMKDQYESLETLDEMRQYYYQVVKKYNKPFNRDFNGMVDNACYFVFLCNKCFNGCYRENKKGVFNQSFGRRKLFNIPDLESFFETSYAVKYGVYICVDYATFLEQIIKLTKPEETFIYFDPPYRKSGDKFASKYTGVNFGNEENAALFNWFEKLDKIGYKLMMSQLYSNDGYIQELYKDYNIKTVTNKQSICSDASRRDNITELLITNY